MTTDALVGPYFETVVQIPDLPGLSIREPVDGPRPPITQAFGVRSVTGVLHKGLDYSIRGGTPLVAVDAGVVEETFTQGVPHYGPIPPGYTDGSPGGYGSQALVRHSWGLTMYAHLELVHVAVGQRVARGEQIGLSDSTGISTGPHLHWECRLPDNKTRFDPAGYIDAVVRPTDEEWYMALTDAQRAALVVVADQQIAGKVVYLGEKGLLIAQTDAYAALNGPQQAKADTREKARITRLGLRP